MEDDEVTVITDTVWVSNRFTFHISPRLKVKVINLSPPKRDQISPRDWPTAWLVKWRDR